MFNFLANFIAYRVKYRFLFLVIPFLMVNEVFSFTAGWLTDSALALDMPLPLVVIDVLFSGFILTLAKDVFKVCRTLKKALKKCCFMEF